jgi:hypothetical protein
MALHLARSGGGKSSREKRDNHMVFSIVLICIVDRSIESRWKSKIEGITTHKLYLLRRLPLRKREGNENEKHKQDP